MRKFSLRVFVKVLSKKSYKQFTDVLKTKLLRILLIKYMEKKQFFVRQRLIFKDSVKIKFET